MDAIERTRVITREYTRLEERARAWAEADERVRGALVLGSRARTDHPADDWADLDVLVVTADAGGLIGDRSWLESIGEPSMSFAERTAGDAPELRVMFAGGYDVDFACMSPELIRHLGEADPTTAAIALGRGYRILVDKDDLVHEAVGRLPADIAGPSVAPPDQVAFGEITSDFWYHNVWTAKHLARGEMWWAMSCCDGYLKHLLRRMLEWQALGEGRDPWFRGRFLEEWADPDAVAGLRRAFAHYESEDIWRALQATASIFADQARRTAELFDLAYDEVAEARARELTERIRTTGSFVGED